MVHAEGASTTLGAKEKLGKVGRPVKSSSVASGTLRYDVRMGTILLPSGQGIAVPLRHRFVLNALMQKRHAGTNARLSSLGYEDVATLFEVGRIEEDLITHGLKPQEKDIRERLQMRKAHPKWDATKVAMEFSRQIRRWLREQEMDPGSLIKCDRANKSYTLGTSWNSKRMVVGQSEASLIYRSDVDMGSDTPHDVIHAEQQDEDVWQEDGDELNAD